MSREVVAENISRIEGLLNFTMIIKDHEVIDARAEALEGVRLLERLLVGKKYHEIPEIASRMCGVCQAIHKVTAVQAVENAFNIELPEEINMLRKLIVIGGHLQSHLLHLYMFVLPDFLGYHSILEMLPSHAELIRKVMYLRKLANVITELIGGRAVHPVTPIVGGLSKLPSENALRRALDYAKEFKNTIYTVLEDILSIDMPSFERRTNYVSLKGEHEFPLLGGNVSINSEVIFKPAEYEDYIKFVTVEYSTARHYVLKKIGREYMVGALARVNNNFKLLSDTTKELIKTYSLQFPSYRPFDNNKAQALELLHFVEEAIYILERLKGNIPRKRKASFKVNEGKGISITEAPRGLLIHHYEINNQGLVEKANIITPTAQNYKCMEADVKDYITRLIQTSDKKWDIKFEAEKLIRAYDPCVSCSARFLRQH